MTETGDVAPPGASLRPTACGVGSFLQLTRHLPFGSLPLASGPYRAILFRACRRSIILREKPFERRIYQHKYDTIEGFTRKYQCHGLVYYESYQDVRVAIAREKQVKRWRQGLAEKWGQEMLFRRQSLEKIP